MRYIYIALILIISLAINTGCAATSFRHGFDITYVADTIPQKNADTHPIYTSNETSSSIYMNLSCSNGVRFFTWMLSPIIPLPPILPGYISHTPAKITLWTDPGESDFGDFDYAKAKLLLSKQDTINGYNIIKIDHMSDSIIWHLSDEITCNDLSSSPIRFTEIKHNGKILNLPSIIVKVEDLGLLFHWEYITP